MKNYYYCDHFILNFFNFIYNNNFIFQSNRINLLIKFKLRKKFVAMILKKNALNGKDEEMKNF